MLLPLPNAMSATYSPEAVFNQPPPLEDYNLFESDCALKEAVHREGGGWIDAEASKFGGTIRQTRDDQSGCAGESFYTGVADPRSIR